MELTRILNVLKKLEKSSFYKGDAPRIEFHGDCSGFIECLPSEWGFRDEEELEGCLKEIESY